MRRRKERSEKRVARIRERERERDPSFIALVSDDVN